VGPFFGGSLSEPAKQYPSLFGRFQILADYPYFLPCAICGTMGLLAALLNVLFLTEVRILSSRFGASELTPLMSA